MEVALAVGAEKMTETSSAETTAALATAADALLRPVLHLATMNKHTYCVIDGLTRYEYINQIDLPDKAPPA